jgi:hypothetical protein
LKNWKVIKDDDLQVTKLSELFASGKWKTIATIKGGWINIKGLISIEQMEELIEKHES